ncbi:MAG: M2 family metallopeptidase [Acidobacteria bacterium]|nr:M2 family metallopeptidase [Acidobacteriota bacterium]
MNWQQKADIFLGKYLGELSEIELKHTSNYWQAANSGKKEDFDTYAASDLELRELHSSSLRFSEIEELLSHKDELNPLVQRSLTTAELRFKENQLPKEILEKLVTFSTEIEQIFNTFRGELDGKKYSNNDLLEMLKKETDSAKREKIWETLKQIGDAVGPKLLNLAQVRNDAAEKLGFKNYWDMQIKLQEHDPGSLSSIFTELDSLTSVPFKEMKEKIDAELAERFHISKDEIMPWHYDNPFFQTVPPSDKIDLDEFYKDKKKEEIIRLAQDFYANIGLDTENIVKNSDLYDREGKDQHAFCIDIDRHGDVRILTNIKPTAEWMETSLHELGHAVYSAGLDFTLPYNLREAAHIFITEAVAMFFGALAKNPSWIITNTGADYQRVKEMAAVILEQRRREQLIFARWTLVMFYFEKALYEFRGNNQQGLHDLNELWWEMAGRFQLLKLPKGRDVRLHADWAAKTHFATAPVYYHNYMLGELFAAQMRAILIKRTGGNGKTSAAEYYKYKETGLFFKEKIFKPGMSKHWTEFVRDVTGEPLTAKYFAGEIK